MHPASLSQGPARPSAVVNAEIRALLERTRRRLSDVERGEYEELLREYADAVRAEVTTAA
ncbi:hypothetical protein ACPC36_08275 [Streptomyces pseudogriseolus]|uniref:hypothetical protein n=1 Tax=Streptomyces pseudogriseolus TaxID=36817 RepID=UPI003FA29404